jgi:hypothetical protein
LRENDEKADPAIPSGSDIPREFRFVHSSCGQQDAKSVGGEGNLREDSAGGDEFAGTL